MYHYIIPCKRESEGLPYKNRKLIQYTLDALRDVNNKDIVITTDDEWIFKKYKDGGYTLHYNLPQESPKKVLQDLLITHKTSSQDSLVTLYPTYPNRKPEDISLLIEEYEESEKLSLLCCVEALTNPFLCLYDLGGGHCTQVTPHNLCRRQDYPKVVQTSHFLSIINCGELDNVNKSLYNHDTHFFNIPWYKNADIDTLKDFEDWQMSNE